MSSDVKRYDPRSTPLGKNNAAMWQEENGTYVTYIDYAALAQERDGLRDSADYYCGQAARFLERAKAAESERDALRAFAQSIMDDNWPTGDVDGGTLQDLAVKHGLLQPKQMDAPCGEDCACTEYFRAEDWPVTCYRRAPLLTGHDDTVATLQQDKLSTEQTRQGLCSICEQPQFDTPSGLTCSNGHGGAPTRYK